jgi:hypothetical protein
VEDRAVIVLVAHVLQKVGGAWAPWRSVRPRYRPCWSEPAPWIAPGPGRGAKTVAVSAMADRALRLFRRKFSMVIFLGKWALGKTAG